jgi:hypothetical protein
MANAGEPEEHFFAIDFFITLSIKERGFPALISEKV